MLNLTIDFHLSQYSSDVAQLIRQNMYVDNFIAGGQSLQECIKIYTEGVTMFREAGMHLRQWGSNCPEFVEMLDPKDKANDMNQASVLGMKWNISSDELMLNRVVIPTVVNTKRHILETISSFFDPLGLCNPLIVGPKLFIQQLWKEKLSWDHHLSSELMKKLETLLTQLLFLESFTIPRFVGIPEDLVAFHLIAFTDASTDAYAANVYICKEAPNGCTFDLLFSKVRLAPAKGLSIPRMELMGVLIGIRLLKYVKGELAVPIVNTFLWTDSQCVLYWIRSTKRLPVFIQNRINEIKEKGTNVILKYIETHHNPADLTTGPQSATSFKENLEMWLHGPKFLHCPISEWPTFMEPEVSPKKIDEWESPDEKIAFASMSLLSPQKQLASPIIDINRFSSLKSVLLFTAILLFVIGKLIWQYVPAQLKSQYPVLSNLLGFNASHGFTADVISKARFYWEWRTQHEVFSDILDSFHTGKLHPMVKQLNLFLDSNGLIRLRGRLQHAPSSYDTKHPKLMPQKHRFTHLLIQDAHQSLTHGGSESVLALLRQQYWIVHGRRAITTFLHKCTICKKMYGPAYKLPPMASLPASRLQRIIPFLYCGLDYLGPFKVKVSGSLVKLWVCLFTCFVSRAIHLEFVSSLTCEGFLLCFRRFIARHGTPKLILSDNASQFQLADRVWNSVRNIKWHYTTQFAPWEGGMYERLVGLVKKSLKMAVGRHQPKFEDFLTYLAESEAIVNMRPLVHISEDPKDSFKLLRPVDFLVMEGDISTEVLEEEQSDPEYFPKLDSPGKMLQWWKSSQRHIDALWEIFYKNYLTALHERYQHLQAHSGTSPVTPQVGHVVMIHEEAVPRNRWKMGMITNLYQRADGFVKSAEVKTQSGSSITRPLNLLYPLEISSDVDSSKMQKKLPKQHDQATSRPVTRSMTKTNTFLTRLAITTLVFMGCFPGCLSSYCPNNNSLPIIESQYCVTHGIVIKKFQDKYCWTNVSCPTGRHLHQNGMCGAKCFCPKWAFACSYAEKPAIVDIQHQTTILEDVKPNVCSFKPDPSCHKNATYDEFNQVQLYDGSLHLVKNLNIAIQETIAEQYTCIGSGPVTGTEAFCKTHECDPNGGSKFCYYKGQDKVYLQTEFGKIRIKAWGLVKKKYYPDKTAELFNPSCKFCAVKCVLGGIQLELEEHISKVMVCPKFAACITISDPSINEDVLLSPKVTMFQYRVEVEIFFNGYRIKTLGIDCMSAPFCESIKCFFCWINIRNLHCFSRAYAVFVVALLLVITFSTGTIALYSVLKIVLLLLKIAFYCVKKLLWIFKKCFHKLIIWCQTYDHPQNHATNENRQMRQRRPHPVYTPRPARDAMLLTMIILLHQGSSFVEGCAKATTLTAASKQCNAVSDPDFSEIRECVFSEATRLVMVPQGQDTCLLISNKDGKPLGTLKITTERISLKCQAETLYYTRSIKMRVESVKRCPNAGSCSGDKCHQYNRDSKIDELSDTANQRPGYTHCVESCGCWACECFFCTPGCLFYRVFAEPRTSTIYEVFRCSIWKFQVQATISMNLPDGNVVSDKITLHPGVATTWRNFEVTLVGITDPPAPVLNSKFLTDGERVIVREASESGQPVTGTIGEFQCGTKEKAENFNECVFPHDMCLCDPQQTRVTCTCTGINIDTMFSLKEFTLPLAMPGLTLHGTGTDIYGTFNTISSLELQVNIEDLRLAYVHDISTCHIIVISFKGCYSCRSGAQLSYKCSTDTGNALAHVSCGQARFSTTCSPSGFTGTTTLAFTEEQVTVTCIVTCPAKDTTFELKGTLVFIEKTPVTNFSNVLVKEMKPKAEWKIDMPDLSDIWKWFKSNWLTVLLAIGLIFVLILLGIFLIPVIFQLCYVKITNVVTQIKKKFKEKGPVRWFKSKGKLSSKDV